MSPTQGLAWGTLQKQFAAGKLGMYIAAPDDIYNVIVPDDKGNINDIGMGPLPSPQRQPSRLPVRRQRLHVRQAGHPGADQGRHQVHQLRGPDAGQGQFNYARIKADGLPVGFPEPELFGGAGQQRISRRSRDKSATINMSYYAPFARTRTRSTTASRRMLRPSTRPWTR